MYVVKYADIQASPNRWEERTKNGNKWKSIATISLVRVVIRIKRQQQKKAKINDQNSNGFRLFSLISLFLTSHGFIIGFSVMCFGIVAVYAMEVSNYFIAVRFLSLWATTNIIPEQWTVNSERNTENSLVHLNIHLKQCNSTLLH